MPGSPQGLTFFPDYYPWAVALVLMVQDVGWSSTHHSYVQAAGRKKEQRAEGRAALLSGMLLEGAPQNFHSHPNGHNLAPRTHLARARLRNSICSGWPWVILAAHTAQWRIHTGEGRLAVSAVASHLISDYCWESIWWIKTCSLLYSPHSEYHSKCRGDFSHSVPSPVPRCQESLVMVSFTGYLNHRILLKSL